MTNLLSVMADAKTKKGIKYGYLTGVLYLAPATSSGKFNTCASASAGCIAACLNFAGRSRFDAKIQVARVRKTHELFADREVFMARLEHDIKALVRKAARMGLTPAVRLNGTSDLPWLSIELAKRFPDVQFYDYTKHARPWTRSASNYHVTFSWSGENMEACREALANGVNVAVPFDLKKGAELPATWQGYSVVDGDLSDLRFLDEVGVIVGLRVKSVSKDRKASGMANGFVQIAGVL